MKKPIFTGSGVAIVTPFTEDKTKVDYDKFEQLIDFQISNGTDAIIVCGTTGESTTQPSEEHLETVRRCAKHVNGRVPVIAGSGSNDTLHAVDMSVGSQECGADALLIVAPYYNKTTQTGLINHITYIADRVEVPIILYNIPGRTGMSFTTDTYYELSKHPLINGVKEASGDMDIVLQTRYKCGDDLNIWSGEDSLIVPIMSLGGKGVISVLGNIAPKLTSDMCHLYLEGKTDLSAKLQIQVAELIASLFCEVNPIPVKAALKLMGLDNGALRMPLCDISESNLIRLKNSMSEVGLI